TAPRGRKVPFALTSDPDSDEMDHFQFDDLRVGQDPTGTDNERPPVLRDTINCCQQFMRAGDHCNPWLFAGVAQTPVISFELWIETNSDQDWHPQRPPKS